MEPQEKKNINMQVIVREFTMNDNDAVVKLWLQCFLALAEKYGRVKTFTQFAEEQVLNKDMKDIHVHYIQHEDNCFWVAEIKEQETNTNTLLGAVGVIVTPINTDNCDETIKKQAEMVRLCVTPEFRRQGIATILIKTVEKYCKTQNINKLILTTSQLQEEALALYIKLRYQQKGNYQPLIMTQDDLEPVYMIHLEKIITL